MQRIIIVVAALASILAACTVPVNNNSQARDAQRTEQQQSIYEVNQPIPAFTYSQDRDTLIQIYRLRNEARLTYTTFHSMNDPQPVFGCPSRGYPIPADTQLTNPQQLAGAWVPSGSSTGDTRSDGKGGWVRWVDGVIELPEPNGIYSSGNTDGTWVLCIRPDGSVHPIYSEMKLQTFPFEVHWDAQQKMLVDGGAQSSSTISIGTPEEIRSRAERTPIPVASPGANER